MRSFCRIDGFGASRGVRRVPFLAGLALAALLGSARPAASVEVSGSPSCGTSGSAFACDIQFSSVSSFLAEDQPFEVDIVLENMQHIELFDDDATGETFSIAIGFDNTGNPNLVNIRFDLAFSDETGAILDPPGEQSPFVFVNVQPDTSFNGVASLLADLGPLTPVLFHDVHLTLTPTGDIQLTSLSQIGFLGIDDTSNVGTWIPEPGTAGLLGAGLLALGLHRRRR